MSTSFVPPADRRLLGIGLSILAYFMFTVIDSSAKWLGMVGIAAVQIVFLRYALHLFLVGALHLPRYGKSLFHTGNVRLQVVRAIALMLSTVFNFAAIQFLPLTVTGSIAFLAPLMICALSVPFLGETVGWRRWTAIGVGFLGILIIIRPGTDAFHPASLLSLCGVFCSAIYMLVTRSVSRFDSAATSQFYASIFPVILLTPVMPFVWIWPDTIDGWIAFFTVGIFGFLGHQLITMASGYAPASVLAPFAYFQIIFLTASSWLVFNQPPDVWMFIGAPIVIGSGLYIWLRERQLAKAVTPIAPEATAPGA